MKNRLIALTVAVIGVATQAHAIAQAPLAATVNGDKITVDEWMSRLKALRAQDFIASTNPLQFKAAQAGQLALESLVTDKLLMQYAAKTSLLPTDAEVNAAYEQIKKQPTYAQALSIKQVTDEMLKANVRRDLTVYNVATINQSVSAAEVKAYYEKHPELYGRPERWQLAIIRVGTKEKADKALAELKKGTPFQSVAATLSEDEATKKNGGMMGFVAAADPAIPVAIKEAVQKLTVGGTTDAIKQTAPMSTTSVYVILKMVGKEEANMTPLDQIKAQVERTALFEKVGGAGALNRKLEEFRKSSTITVTLAGYEELYKKP